MFPTMNSLEEAGSVCADDADQNRSRTQFRSERLHTNRLHHFPCRGSSLCRIWRIVKSQKTTSAKTSSECHKRQMLHPIWPNGLRVKPYPCIVVRVDASLKTDNKSKASIPILEKSYEKEPPRRHITTVRCPNSSCPSQVNRLY